MTDPVELYGRLLKEFDRRDWPQVKALAKQLLPLAPRHPGVYYMVGLAHMEMHEAAAAVEYLRKASILEPRRSGFLVQLAKALTLARRNVDAKTVADRAIALAPTDPATLDMLGVVFTQVGDYSAAASAFQDAARLAPEHAPFRYNLATSLVASGEVHAAEKELEACIALNPKHWLAHLSLTQLHRQTSQANHIGRLESLLRQLGDSPEAEAVMCLNLALAKEYEDLADYSKAFDHLIRGKAAGANPSYASANDEALVSAIMECSPTGEMFAGASSAEPIFIIGMPRTGTTLVERIISSHPDVQSAGELLNFPMAVKHLSGCPTPALIDAETIRRMHGADLTRLGDIYLQSTRPTTGHKLRFIDKLPHNFLFAGLIAQALPNAKIICLRRDPMDTCLSNFRQLFGPKSPFFDYSFDLLDTGRHYILFDRLMKHWQSTLPGRVLEISYETLVGSQEACSRQLLEFCGLSWTDACLRFQENSLPVATASAVQVRAPIYRSSLQRWKKYGAKLDGLRDLLVSNGIPVET